jgi:hydroxyethylthiazole kinase
MVHLKCTASVCLPQQSGAVCGTQNNGSMAAANDVPPTPADSVPAPYSFDYAEHAACATRRLAALRRRVPLVHCITNYVAMDITANVLLAAGASPAMIHAEEEVGEFAGVASALVINVGTLSAEWARSMKVAAAAAVGGRKPWVLDPVGCGATKYRYVR